MDPCRLSSTSSPGSRSSPGSSLKTGPLPTTTSKKSTLHLVLRLPGGIIEHALMGEHLPQFSKLELSIHPLCCPLL
ncbi:unnamed protein product [Cuscuta campestris]|uniref:Uncharacterized protein n=1 Tax=Cuscuta campestris TaxID=132261 RepID=A0A484MRM3_9ASTE|nr:unnamed protein product [Cuscuta campestris]